MARTGGWEKHKIKHNKYISPLEKRRKRHTPHTTHNATTKDKMGTAHIRSTPYAAPGSSTDMNSCQFEVRYHLALAHGREDKITVNIYRAFFRRGIECGVHIYHV
jgi:hypothetical protein